MCVSRFGVSTYTLSSKLDLPVVVVSVLPPSVVEVVLPGLVVVVSAESLVIHRPKKLISMVSHVV